ncbi:MAG: APC family permease [Pseudonocardiaceae bacterium]
MRPGLRGNRVLSLAFGAGLLALLVGLVLLAVVLCTKDLPQAAAWSSVLSTGLAIAVALTTLVTRWLTKRAAAGQRAGSEQVARAAQELQAVVREQWRKEAQARSLGDPDPMPVRWRLSDPAVMDHDEHIAPVPLLFSGRSDRISALTDQFRRLRRRRLVIVVWKIAVPVLTVGVLMWVSFHVSNFTAGGGFAPYGAHGVFAALPLGVFFALQGFEQAAQLAGEARDPQRTVPRAMIGAVIVGTVLYLGLEIAFVGALNSGDLVRGWTELGSGDFGPYATLATGLGLGWLTAILYVDAFISPAGSGLVYLGTSARLSYALAHAGDVPRVVSRISVRGVPYFSIILSFVVGLICFLPFPSWQSLVGLVTSVTVIMYAFAPITLLALRKTEPDRDRPYRLPAASILAPLAFVAANEVIYWTPWATVEKLMLIVVAGYVLFGLSYALGRPLESPPLNPRSLVWILPWFAGLTVISYLGRYGGTNLIPEWVDLGLVAAFSLVICRLAVRLSLPSHRGSAPSPIS